jgi:cytochrome c peroxidase
MLRFLAALTHEPNPRVRGRSAFSVEEARGADAFRARCESCHQARTVSDVEDTRVAFAEWPRHVFSETGGIVWARDGYEDTGVEPRVHESGARPSSLRRIARKRPYFTNGSATDLAAALATSGTRDDGRFSHACATPTCTPLDEDAQRALLAFLLLL